MARRSNFAIADGKVTKIRAQQKLSDLRAQYNAELQRVEQDFNTKYEEFLEGQREFPETILRKRQTELKELLERNIAFKNESRRELEKAEAEVIGTLTTSRHVGVLATEGTINTESYTLEIQKLWPDITVSGVACPFWVPLVEYNEVDSPGADYFVKKRLDQIMHLDPLIDCIILGCTLSPAHAQDSEVSVCRCARGAAGRIRCR